jgi:broad specificity phosphatase PhoE
LAGETVTARIWSSPAVRCIQTVEPLAKKVGVALEVVPWLDEGSDVSVAMRRLKPPESLVACTHGDVIWGVLEILARAGVDLGERPDAQKGSVWLLDWDDAAAQLPQRARYLPPPAKAAWKQ